MTPEQLLQQSDPRAALRALQDQIKAQPGVTGLRVFLFQLLCILGYWERAQTQLKVLSGLDASTLAMVEMYREALPCEALREAVFAGKRTPMILGEPSVWMALLLEAIAAEAAGSYEHAMKLRAEALEQAPATAGTIDGRAFDWIADADPRLGPVCEMVINGKYYWVPYERIKVLALEQPEDLRDLVWMPAQVQLANGGEWVALIPSRYPGSEADSDGAVCMGRKTVWNEVHPDLFHGRGQRVLVTDRGEYSFIGTQRIELGSAGKPGE